MSELHPIINMTEKEVSKAFGIPMHSLKRCRNEKRFTKDICFTPPYSCKVLYDKYKFKEWFDQNKLPGLQTENQYIRTQLKNLNQQEYGDKAIKKDVRNPAK